MSVSSEATNGGIRVDLDIIQNWVAPATRVLDLGCGDGTLLHCLARDKHVEGYGLEIGAEEITACIARGINVIEQDIDQPLDNFDDNSFDTVIMTQALQAMRHPHLVLAEMLRVGKECVITFPNFGHWKTRWHLARHGRMPVSDLLPYEWYDTPNIHFCTFRDFEVLCREQGFKILHRQVVTNGRLSAFKDLRPNLFGHTAIYHLSQ